MGAVVYSMWCFISAGVLVVVWERWCVSGGVLEVVFY